MKIRILNILRSTMADGPGLRDSVYCAGCQHHCLGCHNPESWDMMGGKEWEVEELAKVLLEDPFTNITFSGGDPMYQVEAFTALAKIIKARSSKNIWLYTGFTLEQITVCPRLSQILPYIDTIVDGPYVESLRDTSLQFRGSTNQRIINLTDIKKEP